VKYSIVGDGLSTTLFEINEDTGLITLAQSFSVDAFGTEYTVSIKVNNMLSDQNFKDFSMHQHSTAKKNIQVHKSRVFHSYYRYKIVKKLNLQLQLSAASSMSCIIKGMVTIGFHCAKFC